MNERWLSWNQKGLEKTWSYFIDYSNENKIVKGTKKRIIKFEDYTNCLEANQFENEIDHPEKNIEVDV